MAANWQAPFGQPFPFPPPQTPQTPQQQQQQPQQQAYSGQHAHNATEGGRSNPYLTPTLEGFASPWPSIPGLNMQSYNQNAQQTPYSPTAWPPMPPTPDAWNQAMQQMQFPWMQNSAFPPPPIPGLGFPPPFPHTPLQNPAPMPVLSPAAPSFQPQQQQQQPVTVADDRITEVMDSDKEDGEVSEADLTSQPPAVNGSARREPPRSVPQSNARLDGPIWKGHRERYNPEQPAAGQEAPGQREDMSANTASSSNGIAIQREEAKQFVKLLHSNNVGYRALAAEGFDPAPLRDLYRSLNLPSEPEPVPPSKALNVPITSTATVPAVPPPIVTSAEPTPSIKTNVAVAPPKSAPSPIDRKDYIARLQAAKKGKQAMATKTTPPQKTPPAVSNPATTTTKRSISEEAKARQTSLIKQRLEAMTKTPSSPANPPTNGSAPAMTNASPARFAEASPIVKTTPRPQQPMPTTPFTGIPGLFMNSPLIVPPVQVTPNPRKRSLVSDFAHVSTPTELGDDVQMANNESGSNVAHSSGDRNSQWANLPSRPASTKPLQSAVSTPGAQTPGSQARAEEMDGKQKALAAMKIKVQQRMKEQRAEKERLAKAAEAASNKRQRREELEAGLAAMAAEMEAHRVKMAQALIEMDQMKTRDDKIKQEKARLAQELEELGIDTEGMPHTDLQIRKDEIERELRVPSASVSAVSSEALVLNHTSAASKNHDVEAMTPPRVLPRETEPARHVPEDTAKLSPPLVIHSTNPFQHVGIPGLGASMASGSRAASVSPDALDLHKPQSQPEHVTLATTPQVDGFHDPAVVQATVSKASEVVEAATPVDEEEDFYSPKPAEEPHVAKQPVPIAAHAEPKLPSEDGEIAMSESEEEYEPDEPQELTDTALSSTAPQDVMADRQPASPSSSSASSSSSDDEEMYEPPDVDVPIRDAKPREPSAESGEIDDGAMDISTSDESDGSDGSDSSSESPANESRDSVAPSVSAEQVLNIADDSAPEMQTESDPAVTDEHDVLTQKIDPWAFVPYESPLRQFKSYRYHPSYMQEVPGGFMSMTYSHQIDAHKQLCPTETTGVSCDDPQCQFQHFQGMNLNGERLLVQLGTANPGKTRDEQQKWNEGLRQVLKVLRQKQTKDPNGIALAIAQYRRQFLDDPTRVVSL